MILHGPQTFDAASLLGSAKAADDGGIAASAVMDAEAGYSRAAEAINRFAFDLYKHFQQEQGNLFLSPMSIATALAMTYAGGPR